MAGSEGSIVSSGGGGVESLNSKTGAVTVESSDSSVTVDNSGSNVDLSVDFPVDSINSKTGAVTISSADSSVTVAGTGSDVDLSVSSSSVSRAIFSERQSSGTDGGTFSSGARRTRPLNNVDSNADSIASLASNRITISTSGTYFVRAWAVALGVTEHRINFSSVSGTTVEVLGVVSRNNAASDDVATLSILEGVFTVDVESDGNCVLELQHECASTKNDTGFGEPSGFGEEEVFASVTLETS